MDYYWPFDELHWYRLGSEEEDALLDTALYKWTMGAELVEPVVPTFDIRTFGWMHCNVALEELTTQYCFCCDSLQCKLPRGEINRLEGYQLGDFLYINYIQETDLYKYSDDLLDCRTCVHYMTYHCVPLRNWVRWYLNQETTPPELTLCKNHHPDTMFIEANNLKLSRVQEKIYIEQDYAYDH